jgi:hypothetical protein
MRSHHVLPALAVSVVVGCDGGSAVAPRSPQAAVTASADASAAQPVDVGGTWSWREEVVLQVPEVFALPFFGIEPEGPITIGRCVNSGIMELVQIGATFSGTATQSSDCVTRGGQRFSPPAFTSILDIRDGEIRGRSIRVVFGAGDVPCLYHATIAESEDGIAVGLRGGGRCIPPGHPQSPLSGLGLPFPSGPISPTVLWEATRL